MRVLRISHSAVVDSWRERERSLRRLGVEVRVLSACLWDEGGADVPLVPREGEPVLGVRTWGRHPALFVYDPRPLWRALGRQLDLVDVHEEPFALATAEILLLRRLRRQPAPYTLYSAQNIAKRYPVPFRWLERWSLGRAAGISVCNREAGRIVQSKGLPGLPSFIPLGIDTTIFRPHSGGSVDASPERIHVGYVGRLAKHKGVGVLLEAMAGDERLHLHLAGGGPMAAELREQARSLGVEGRVQFLGSLAQEDLPGFYAGLHVLAVPSLPTPGWVEQFGRVAIEAMACGVPVVASDTGALPDVVGEAGSLVSPGEPGPLRDAVVRYGTDPGDASSARSRGFSRAAECSWERVAERYLAMYEKVLHVPATVGPDRPLEVVVIAFGAPALLENALEPVRHLPVTVVDNSSSDEVRRVCATLGVVYLDPGFNGGFGTGVNFALKHRRQPDSDVLLLNPDAVVSADAIFELQRALATDSHLASVGPAQVDGRGNSSRVGWPFPTPWGAWVEALGLGRLRSPTQFVIGSVLLLRAEALAQVGGFDERFFLYAEETDWAYRARRLGWCHAVVPSATAVHMGAATSTDPRQRELHFHASQERYLRKHYGELGWQTARLGQLTGAIARSLVLPRTRAEAARARAQLYLRGPVRAESHGRFVGETAQRVSRGAA